MKKYISPMIIASLILSFFSVSLVQAEDAKINVNSKTSDVKLEDKNAREQMQAERYIFKAKMESERKSFMQSLQSERTAFMAELKSKKEEFKSANQTRKEEFRANAEIMIGEKFDVAVIRLENIQTRVGNVIEKLKTDGKDTVSISESLQLSIQKLTEAKAKIAEIKTMIPDSGVKVTADVFEKIKLSARDAKNLLKESKEYLRQTINEIKNLNS